MKHGLVIVHGPVCPLGSQPLFGQELYWFIRQALVTIVIVVVVVLFTNALFTCVWLVGVFEKYPNARRINHM